MSNELRYERVIDGPPDVVFEAFTTPSGQEAFYGRDDPGWITRSECELRVGGLWTVVFGPNPDALHRHRHVFKAIDRPWRLALATTELRANGSSLTFATEFTFAEQDGRTLMTMVQTGLPTELRDEHGRGLPEAFARLACIVETMWSNLPPRR